MTRSFSGEKYFFFRAENWFGKSNQGITTPHVFLKFFLFLFFIFFNTACASNPSPPPPLFGCCQLVGRKSEDILTASCRKNCSLIHQPKDISNLFRNKDRLGYLFAIRSQHMSRKKEGLRLGRICEWFMEPALKLLKTLFVLNSLYLEKLFFPVSR
jgi:hypothetical protein